MKKITLPTSNLLEVNNFQDLVSTPFQGLINAISWKRELVGDFEEIVQAIIFNGNMVEIDEKDLINLDLSEAGKLAREILLTDFKLLKEHGVSPVLNIINNYEEDEHPFFPTDVYSFHIDRSTIATDTFLCTYFGETSELISNDEVVQKIQVHETREKLLQIYEGKAANFDSFLQENFFDLHYQALPKSTVISTKIGHLLRLAVDFPESHIKPCVHRAPRENIGRKRLLMIC